ncbi:hypothetical protein BG004_004710 [Podila humilis]|nr:hypothetical protein BG004_004710 [Podila humilis]
MERWTTIAPPWAQHRSSPFQNSYHVATSSRDNKTLIFWGANRDPKNRRPPAAFMNQYNIETDTWTVGKEDSVKVTATPPNPGFMMGSGRCDFGGALDPTVGKYLFVGGNNGQVNINAQDVYEFATNSVRETAPPATSGMVGYQGGALAWLKTGEGEGGSAVYALGGHSANNTGWTLFSTLLKFSWASESWSVVIPTNSAVVPPPRQYHCAASAADGSKAVIFGGWAPPGNYVDMALNDLWIIDAATMTWKKGTTPGGFNVGYSTCIIAGDQLIVWGGFQRLNSTPPVSSPMRVYDMTADRWRSSYNPSPEYQALIPPPSPPPPPPSDGDSDNDNDDEASEKPNLAIILAGVFGAGFAILAGTRPSSSTSTSTFVFYVPNTLFGHQY